MQYPAAVQTQHLPHHPYTNHDSSLYENPRPLTNPNPNTASSAVSYSDTACYAQQAMYAAAVGATSPAGYAQNSPIPSDAGVATNGAEQLIAAQVSPVSWNSAAEKKIQKIPIPHVRCEVCNIECNSKEILESHKQGKSHEKNLEKLKVTLAPAPVAPQGVPNNPIISSQKPKVPVPPVLCEVCKIGCSSKEILESHKQGKKHKKNLEKLKATVAPVPVALAEMPNNPIISSQKPKVPVPAVLCEVCKVGCSSKEILESHKKGKKHKKNLEKLKATVAPVPVALAEMPNNPIISSQEPKVLVPPVLCEVCKVGCSSKEILESHKKGRKHKKNLEKLKATVAPVPVALAEMPNNPIIGPQKTPEKRKAEAKEPEDLEMKRQKVVESGTPVDSVRTCELCDVVCNSDLVFKYHLAGQKHVAMVKNRKVGCSNVNPILIPHENPETMKAKAKEPEDLESKKKKIVESGTSMDAVKTCELCNVVCNSDLVFKYHLAGQKHVAMVKKGEIGPQAT